MKKHSLNFEYFYMDGFKAFKSHLNDYYIKSGFCEKEFKKNDLEEFSKTIGDINISIQENMYVASIKFIISIVISIIIMTQVISNNHVLLHLLTTLMMTMIIYYACIFIMPSKILDIPSANKFTLLPLRLLYTSVKFDTRSKFKQDSEYFVVLFLISISLIISVYLLSFNLPFWIQYSLALFILIAINYNLLFIVPLRSFLYKYFEKRHEHWRDNVNSFIVNMGKKDWRLGFDERRLKAKDRKEFEAEKQTEEIIQIIQFSFTEYSSLVKNTLKLQNSLKNVELKYQNNSFSPFWDEVIIAMSLLKESEQYFSRIEDLATRYYEALAGKEHTFPTFPISKVALPNYNQIIIRLFDIIRLSQTNFNFSVIYEHRATRKVIIEGFNTVELAVDGLEKEMNSSFKKLYTHLDTLSSQIEAKNEMSSALLEIVSTYFVDIKDFLKF